MRGEESFRCAVLIRVEEIEEIQPTFQLKSYVIPHNIALICPTCGDLWARLHLIWGDGEQGTWRAHEAWCRNCGDGSFLQWPTRWVYQGAPEDQQFGPLLLKRELDLAVELYARLEVEEVEEGK